MPHFSLILGEVGKFADITTNREEKKPGRTRVQLVACPERAKRVEGSRQVAQTVPALSARGMPHVGRTLLSATAVDRGAALAPVPNLVIPTPSEAEGEEPVVCLELPHPRPNLCRPHHRGRAALQRRVNDRKMESGFQPPVNCHPERRSAIRFSESRSAVEGPRVRLRHLRTPQGILSTKQFPGITTTRAGKKPGKPRVHPVPPSRPKCPRFTA